MGNDPCPHRCGRIKNPVNKLTYDSYIAWHCAYKANVVEVIEPTCFDEGVGDVK